MYLSILSPQLGSERAAAQQRANDDAYGDHQWLWKLFPAPPGTPRDFLFRCQFINGLPRYHVLSAREPVMTDPVWRLQKKAFAPNLVAGDRLAFEIRANPTVTHDRTGKSQRHDVVMNAKKKKLEELGLARWADWTADDKPSIYDMAQEHGLAWLNRRGTKLGFELDLPMCIAEAYEQTGRLHKPGLKFTTLDLSGELRVTDPVRFQTALFQGVGHAKAFGCGLLLIRRPD